MESGACLAYSQTLGIQVGKDSVYIGNG